MFTKKITDDENFTSLSSSAQALYFHLNQCADDDGFTNQISVSMFKAHASEDDLKVLLAKRYIIRFKSGVLAIKHWRMHNTLRKDRYTPTSYQEELNLLGIKKNGSYTLNLDSAEWLPSGCQVVATGKVSKEEYSIDEYSVVESSGNGNHINNHNGNETEENVDNSVDNSFEYMDGQLGKGVVLLTNAQRESLLEKLGIDAFDHYVDRLSTFILNKNAKVGNHYQTILKWVEEDSRV